MFKIEAFLKQKSYGCFWIYELSFLHLKALNSRYLLLRAVIKLHASENLKSNFVIYIVYGNLCSNMPDRNEIASVLRL